MKDIEVVISGMSGSFPKCASFEDVKEALLTEKNLGDFNPRKWTGDYDKLKVGVLENCTYFDSSYFGISRSLCVMQDPACKMFLENTFEAIVDAGINPATLRNSKTAVIMANSKTEWDALYQGTRYDLNVHGMLGRSKAMDANRVSFFFGFVGPSYVMNSTEAGGLAALHQATHLIKKGLAKQVVVGASNTLIKQYTFYPYDQQLHILSHDGETRSFSDNANGFWRSEGSVVLFLQRKEDAFRSYATIEKSESYFVGNPTLHPLLDRASMEEFLKEFYTNEKVDDIALLVAEGIGLHEVDAVELNSIAKAVATKRKDPLRITSCKSMTGHAEACSPLFSVVTAIIALQTNKVIPITNYSSPNHKVQALKDGKLQIVTEQTPLNGDRVAVNAFSTLLNEYGHLILRRTETKLPNPMSSLPFVIGISGREEDALRKSIQLIRKGASPGAIALTHKAFKTQIPGHTYRAFGILTDPNSVVVENFDLAKPKPVWFIYSGMGSQWITMGRELMKIKLFAESAQRTHEILKKEGIDFLRIMTSDDLNVFDNITNAFVGITGVQVALTDVLTALGIKPDGMIGHSLGEVSCAYADGCFTNEQTVLAALARGRASIEANLVKGMMAAVGLGYHDIKDQLPEEVEVACHNSSTSCTLSGKAEAMEKFVAQLKSKKVFAKLVNVNNIAYHSKNIAPAAPYLLRALKKVVPEAKKRSSRWISTSVPESKWNNEEAQYSSAQYHTNNLLNYVYFEEGSQHIPDDAICIEIAPHGLLQAIVKRSLPNCVHVPLTNRASNNPVQFFLSALGKLYLNGVNVDFEKLYPQVEFPVPCDTWNLQQLVTWVHDEKWHVELYEQETRPLTQIEVIKMDANIKMDHTIKQGYIINNQSLLPCSFFLGKVIKMFHKVNGTDYMNTPILIQDLVFYSVTIPDDRFIGTITLLQEGGFEVLLGDEQLGQKLQMLMTGRIQDIIDSSKYITEDLPYIPNENSFEMSREEIYSYFQDYNYHFKGPFKSLNSIVITEKGYTGEMKVFGELEYKIDALISSAIFYNLYETGTPVTVARVQSIAIDPKLLTFEKDGPIVYESITGLLATDGILMANVTLAAIPWESEEHVDIKRNIFLPYHTYQPKDEHEFYDVCSQLIVENTPRPLKDFVKTVKSISVRGNAKSPIKLNNLICRLANCELVTLSLAEMIVNCQGSDCSYVVTYEGNTVPSMLDTLLSRTSSFLFLHVPSGKQASLPDDIITIYSFTSKQHSIHLLKKKRSSMPSNSVIKTSSPNWEQQLPKIGTSGDSQFVLMENMLLSEVSNTISRLSSSVANNVRFLSVDKKLPPFDVKSPTYQDIMKYDFKVAISQGGVFGSVRNLKTKEITGDASANHVSFVTQSNKNSSTEVKAVTLSFSEPVKPSLKSEAHAYEYAGLKDGKQVMGICDVNGGILERDQILFWETPSTWSLQQAATVPLYYSMAYYILLKYGIIKKGSIFFIHAGYSHMSQAFIRVALSLGARVMTSYFTDEQRRYITTTFPELDEKDVILCNKSRFGMEVMTRTAGHGANLVVNTLGTEYVDFCLEILYAEEENSIGGRMVQISVEPMSEDYTFGMEIFFKKSGVYGFVSSEVLRLSKDDKEWLKTKMREGIKAGVVKPLDHIVLDYCQNPSQIINSAINASQTLPMKKAVISYSKTPSSTRPNKSNLKKSILIVGTQNALCYDIINCYVSKAYRTFHLFLDKETMSPVLARRLRSLQKRNPDLAFEFHPTKILNSAHDCEMLIQYIQKASTLDNVFHVSSDRDSTQCNHLDTALRKFAKDITLISIGKSGQQLCEIRRKDGYNSVSFLHAPNMPNRVIAQGIEKVLNCQDGSLGSVFLDNPDHSVCREPKLTKSSLPEDVKELLDINSILRTSESFVPLSSRGTDYKLLKDSSPVIVLPGFRVDKLSKFVASLPYPGYMATLPLREFMTGRKLLSDLALQISKDILREFDSLNLITIVCEGWSGLLALQVVRFLEVHRKQCCVIMLNSTPARMQTYFRSISEMSILSKYFDLNVKEIEKLDSLPSFESKVDEVLRLPVSTDLNKAEVRHSLLSMKRLIEMLNEFELTRVQVKGKVFLITPDLLWDRFDSGDLNVNCMQEVTVYQVSGEDAMCPETKGKLISVPLYQNNVMPTEKKDLQELTKPFSLCDIPTKGLHIDICNNQLVTRLRRGYNYASKYDDGIF